LAETFQQEYRYLNCKL